MASGNGLQAGKLSVQALERLGNTAILVVVLLAVWWQWSSEELTNRQLFQSIDQHLGKSLTADQEYILEKRNLIKALQRDQEIEAQWLLILKENYGDLRTRLRDTESRVTRLENQLERQK